MNKIAKLNLPEYTVKTQTNYSSIGNKIDEFLKNNFLGENLVIRAISCSERAQSAEETIKTILANGTDRTNKDIKGRGYEKHDDIDIFGVKNQINENTKTGEIFVRNFYEQPLKHGSNPLKIDLLVLYDSNKLEKVEKSITGKKMDDAYKFKTNDKSSAIRSIIRIT